MATHRSAKQFDELILDQAEERCHGDFIGSAGLLNHITPPARRFEARDPGA
jgi:hypothetical protein